MSIVASPPHEPRTDALLSTPPPSSSSFNPPPFHHSISSPVVVPFPVYNQPRLRSYNMSHTHSFSALGPKREIHSDPSPSVPPPAPRPSVQQLPPASPDSGVIVPSQLPPTPDPSPPNSKVLFQDSIVNLIHNDPPTSAETPRRIPLPSSESTSVLPTRSRAMTQVPIRPPNEHRTKSMGPPRPLRKSQTVYPSSVRMSETHSADGRHRVTTFGVPLSQDSPGFPRTMTAPPDTSLGSGDATPSELNGTDGLEAKVVLLGSQGVGKTSLILRYTKGSFNTAPATIGSSLHTRKLVHAGVRVKLQIWDTAGQERFRSMAPIYYRGAHVCILVYDISDRSSFEDVRSWLEELKKTVPKETVIYIVGSKIDLRGREVSIDEARRTLRTWLRPQPSEIMSPPDRGLFRSASLAVRDSPPASVVTTPTRSHSHSALVTLSPDPSLPLSRTQSHLKTSPTQPAETPKPRSSVPFPSSRPLAPPVLHIIPPPPSTLPISPRSTRISFGTLQSPSRPTSMTFTEPVSPLITPASPSHGISGGRFSISGVLGYSRTNSTSGAISNLARLAEDYPASPRNDDSTSLAQWPVPRRVRIESTPHMALLDNRRRSEDWSSPSGRPWRMGEGPGAAEALGEFGAGVRRRQSGGNLLEGEIRPMSPSLSTSNFTKTPGRSRGGSVGRDNRLYGDTEPLEEVTWGTEVEGIRMGEVSALSGQGIDALFKSISALLVEKREKIERDRTLRRKDSVMLGDLKTDTPAGKTKRGGCCV